MPYKYFAKTKDLVHKIIAASYGQTKTRDGYDIQRVNQLHQNLKQWLAPFNGLATKYLQNYLQFYRIAKRLNSINNFKEHLKKIYQFVLAVIPSFVRYKDIDARPIF